MSTGSADYYLTEEERARRALEAARARLNRLGEDLDLLRIQVAAAQSTFPGLAIDVPAVVSDAKPDTVTAVEAAIVDAGAALERARSALNAARGRALQEHFHVVVSSLTPTLSEDDATSARGLQRTASGTVESDVDRILARLPDDCSEKEAADAEASARLVIASSSGQQADLATHALRRVVQAAADKSARRRRNEATVGLLLAALDGAHSDAVRQLRYELRSVDLSSDLPSGLESRVHMTARLAEEAATRHRAVQAVERGLRRLGYRVGEGFQTLVPAGGLVVQLPGRKHGVDVSESDGRFHFDVVRLGEHGPRDAAADADATRAWCRDALALERLAQDHGVRIDVGGLTAPGSHALRSAHASTGRVCDHRTKEKSRERDGKGRS